MYMYTTCTCTLHVHVVALHTRQDYFASNPGASAEARQSSRPGTASARPGTATARPGTAGKRPGSASGLREGVEASTARLFRDPFLNSSAILMEYLSQDGV